MPIVKYVEREDNLPEAVAREMDRYTASSYVALENYEKYRNAALALHKRGKVKLSYEKLYDLADKVCKEHGKDVFNAFNWAISNTANAYWRNNYNEAKERAGKHFDEAQWNADHERNHDNFEASLFSWYKIDSRDEHPAILLLDLLSRYDPRAKK